MVKLTKAEELLILNLRSRQKRIRKRRKRGRKRLIVTTPLSPSRVRRKKVTVKTPLSAVVISGKDASIGAVLAGRATAKGAKITGKGVIKGAKVTRKGLIVAKKRTAKSIARFRQKLQERKERKQLQKFRIKQIEIARSKQKLSDVS